MHADDKVICQAGGHLVDGSQTEWRPEITGNKSAGNVCFACIRRWAEKQKHDRDAKRYADELPERDFYEGDSPDY